MKLGIIGFGNVGKAVYNGLLQFHDVWVNDIQELPNIKNYPIYVLAQACDAIFVCVPTPKAPDGSADLSNVFEVVANLNADSCKGLIILKSTVLPGTTDILRDTYKNLRFACNPDFLRENYANEDFITPNRIVFGIYEHSDFNILEQIYQKWTCPKVKCSPTEAELIKHLSNAYLTLKVAYACEIGSLCKLYGASPLTVASGIALDSRIGHSHLNPELGKIKWDSPCLPKDLLALIKTLESKGGDSRFLKSILEIGVEKQ